jgi:hypothetical protein
MGLDKDKDKEGTEMVTSSQRTRVVSFKSVLFPSEWRGHQRVMPAIPTFYFLLAEMALLTSPQNSSLGSDHLEQNRLPMM